MAASPALTLYRALSGLVSPVVPLLLRRRLKTGKEDAARLNERLGHPARPRPPGPLVWLHGASVGETVSILPLVAPLMARGFNVMLTSGTVTSAAIADKRLPEGAFHQFIPVDTPGAAKRFIAHWKPEIGLIAESELWPNLIMAASAAGTRLAIINGRMSDRSLRKWQKLPEMIGALLGAFSLCLAQSDGDAARYRALGAAGATSPGNLKFDVAALGCDAVELGRLTDAIGARPRFVMASTHPGEEEILIASHRSAAARLAGLVTVIAPRHPQRGEPIAALARAAGLSVARRSTGETIGPQTDLYIADTIGELGLIYRLAPLAFLGGSYIPHGGQNPIEPAKLGVGVLHGPHVFNFTDVYAAFDAAGGSLAVDDPDRLGETIAALLADPARLAAMQSAAQTSADALGGALARTLEALEPLLAAAREGAR